MGTLFILNCLFLTTSAKRKGVCEDTRTRAKRGFFFLSFFSSFSIISTLSLIFGNEPTCLALDCQSAAFFFRAGQLSSNTQMAASTHTRTARNDHECFCMRHAERHRFIDHVCRLSLKLRLFMALLPFSRFLFPRVRALLSWLPETMCE